MTGVFEHIQKAVDVLKRGGIIVYPTETVYGIGCDPLDGKAYARIQRLKGRNERKPMLLLGCSTEQIEEFAGRLPEPADFLARYFWPGQLTVVFKPQKKLPYHLYGGNEGVAFRVSPHPTAFEITRRFGRPITSTSANTSGKPPVLNCEEAVKQFGGLTDAVVENTGIMGGVPSTVVDVTGAEIRFLREGSITFERIRGVL